MPRKRNRTKENGENVLAKKIKIDEEDVLAEDYFKPIEKDGESVLAIECGPNKAHMYLSKLYQGSKGSCVSFQGSWLTPNEFQYVSGRETAKDWKRSIRHQGLSLKILFTRGILSVRKLRENEENTTPTGQQSPSARNHSGVTDTTKQTSGLHSRKANKRGKRHHGVTTKKLSIKAAVLGVPDDASSAAEKSDGSHTGDKERVLEAKQDQENTFDVETEIDEPNTFSTEIVKGESIVKTARNEKNQMEGLEVGCRIDQTKEQKTTVESNGGTKNEEETLDDKTDGSGSPCEGEEDTKNSPMPVLCKEEIMTGGEISETDIDTKSVVLGSPVQKDERINPPHLDYCSNAMVADEAETSTVQTTLTNPLPECTNTSVGKLHEDIVLPKSPVSSDSLAVNQQNSPCDSFTSSVLPRSTPSNAESPRATQPVHSGSIRSHLADMDERAHCNLKKGTLPVMPRMHKAIDDKAEATVKAAALNSLISSLHRSAARQPHYSTKEMEYHHYSVNGLRQSLDSSKSTHTVPRQDMSNIHNQDISRSTSLVNSKMNCSSLEQQSRTTTSKGYTHHNQPASGYQNSTEPFLSEKAKSKADVKRHPKNPREHHISRGVISPKINLDNGLRGFQNGVFLPDYDALHTKMQKDYNEYMTLLASAYRRPFPFIPVPVTSPTLPEVYAYSKLYENRVQSSSLPKGISAVQSIPTYAPDYSQFYNPFPVVSPKLPLEIPSFSTVPPLQPNSKPVKIFKETKPIQKFSKSEHVDSNVVLDLSKKKLPQSDAAENFPDYSKPLDFSRTGDKLKENGKMDLKWNSDESYVHKRHRSPNLFKTWIEKSDFVPKSSDEASFKYGANSSDDIQNWTVDQVCSFLSKLEGCSMYTKTFREQGITGQLLPFLTTEQLTRCLGMKMGPALFFVQAVERKLRESRSSLSYKLCNGKVGVDVQM